MMMPDEKLIHVNDIQNQPKSEEENWIRMVPSLQQKCKNEITHAKI